MKKVFRAVDKNEFDIIDNDKQSTKTSFPTQLLLFVAFFPLYCYLAKLWNYGMNVLSSRLILLLMCHAKIESRISDLLQTLTKGR